MKQVLKSYSPPTAHSLSKKITNTLSGFINKKENIRTVATFASLPYEPDLSALHDQLHGKELVYPLCHDLGKLTFHKVKDFQTLIKGQYGIPEPNPAIHPEISPSEIDLILCPAYAYTAQGERLGKGGGYYDRFLALVKDTAPLKVGIIFANQLVAEIPTLDHDTPVDEIITENGQIQATQT